LQDAQQKGIGMAQEAAGDVGTEEQGTGMGPAGGGAGDAPLAPMQGM
jgi:hypothetical protein